MNSRYRSVWLADPMGMGDLTSDEKRRDPRYAVRLACEVICGSRFPGVIKDISRSGLFVYTLARPTPGNLVTVAIPPQGSHREIRVTGVVVRVERTTALAHLGPETHGGIGIEATVGTLGRLLGDLLRREGASDSDAL